MGLYLLGSHKWDVLDCAPFEKNETNQKAKCYPSQKCLGKLICQNEQHKKSAENVLNVQYAYVTRGTNIAVFARHIHRYKINYSIMWKCNAYAAFSTRHLQQAFTNNNLLSYIRQSLCRHNGMTTHMMSTTTMTVNVGDGMKTIVTKRTIHPIIVLPK